MTLFSIRSSIATGLSLTGVISQLPILPRVFKVKGKAGVSATTSKGSPPTAYLLCYQRSTAANRHKPPRPQPPWQQQQSLSISSISRYLNYKRATTDSRFRHTMLSEVAHPVTPCKLTASTGARPV